jgi:hypothetical protein
MDNPNKIRRVKTALGLDRLSVPQMLFNGAHYVEQMTGNPYFPSPVPTLAEVSAQITVLEQAYNLSLTRVIGSYAAKKTERAKLHSLLTGLAGYVETRANADPPNASIIVKSSGMPEKGISIPTPNQFSAVPAGISGEVIITTKAVIGGTYIYQISTNPLNEAEWTTIYIGSLVEFTMKGLKPGIYYYFRHAINLKGIQSDWSPPIVLLVP